MRAAALVGCFGALVVACSTDAVPSTETTETTSDETAGTEESGSVDAGWCLYSRHTGLPAHAYPVDFGLHAPAFVATASVDGESEVQLHVPTSNGWEVEWSQSALGSGPYFFDDIDGDGFEDLLRRQGSNSVWYRSLGLSGFDPQPRPREGSPNDSWGRYDADEFPDLIIPASGKVQIRRGLGNGEVGELLHTYESYGWGPTGKPVVLDGYIFAMLDGDLGPGQVILGRRDDEGEWSWSHTQQIGPVPSPRGVADIDEDGTPEMIHQGGSGRLWRSWVEGDFWRNEVMADGASFYVYGRHSSGVHWILTHSPYDDLAVLHRYAPGVGLLETLGEFELGPEDYWSGLARDYGGRELEFKSEEDGELVLRHFAPCEG